MLRASGLGVTEQVRVVAQATRDATQRFLVQTAKREHNRVMTTDPRPVKFTRTVDGRRGAIEETVKPDGIIVYDYPRMDEIVQFAMNTLFDLSPVDSGDYRNSHQIFVGGRAVPNLKEWDGDSDIVIANFLPYSRKIELGKMRMRVPGTDHVYEQAEWTIHRRYGNVANVVFTFQGIVGGVSAGAKGGGNKSQNRFPALRIWSR